MKVAIDQNLSNFPLTSGEVETVFSFLPEQLAKQVRSLSVCSDPASALPIVKLTVGIS